MVSLGTSDTLVLYMDKPIRCLQGHVFVNPLDDNAYMGMIWFVNVLIINTYFFCLTYLT